MVKNDTSRQYRGPLGVMGNILGRGNSGTTRSDEVSESSMTNAAQDNRVQQHSVASELDPSPLSPGSARRKSRTHPASNRGSPSRVTPNLSLHHAQHTSPTASPLSRDTLAAIIPPLGLNGPTSFHFSPKTDSPRFYGGRYLSFLSSHDSSSPSTTHVANNANAAAGHISPSSVMPGGSPVRTMGGGTSTSGVIAGEKRLCVMDLDTVWRQIHLNDEANTEQLCSDNGRATTSYTHFPIPSTDPDEIMSQHVAPLLVTSSSPSRSAYDNQQSRRQRSPTRRSLSPVKRHEHHVSSPIVDGGNEPKISLEESLRRERQRIHSRGITEFSWGSIDSMNVPSYPSNDFNLNEHSRANSNEMQGPRPEDILMSRGSKDKPLSVLTPYNEIEDNESAQIRIIVPLRGNIYVQDGVASNVTRPLRLLYDKSMLEGMIHDDGNRRGQKRGNDHAFKDRTTAQSRSKGSTIGRDAGAIDPQLSPDGTMVAFVVAGEVYVMSCATYHHQIGQDLNSFNTKAVKLPVRITYGAMIDDEETMSNSNVDCNDMECDSDYHETSEEYGQAITHGLADFLSQEEMDRYRGFWWHPESKGILFVRVDESCVPPYRITHQGNDGCTADEASYEDHRYPFAGERNPQITLGYVTVDKECIMSHFSDHNNSDCDGSIGPPSPERRGNTIKIDTATDVARQKWSEVQWFDAPEEASEYLARVNWLPDGSVCVQWQNRSQSTLILQRIETNTGKTTILHKEESDVWINLHQMFRVLARPIHPDECLQHLSEEGVADDYDTHLPDGSFSFVFASERTGFCHLYLYTYIPGHSSATLLRPISSGEWIVESIVGIDISNDVIYITGTYDSPLERHLYALPLTGKSVPQYANVTGLKSKSIQRGWKQVMSTLGNAATMSNFSSSDDRNQNISQYNQSLNDLIPSDPLRLTRESGMHSVVMDESCRIFVDTSSDLSRSTSTKVYCLPKSGPFVPEKNGEQTKVLFVPYDSTRERAVSSLLHVPVLAKGCDSYPPPEILTFPTKDGTEMLHAALYRPNPSMHGPGPYPLICAVYGGPHVQRVNRSWGQCTDMRVQRLCSLGFAVVKCDNRGSSRRGLAFEGAIKNRLGRLEVLDQVAAVRYLAMRGIIDQSRVGIYGWSYGGYLAAMCLCRAPDVFHVGIAGAPVTSWDGYDTHYTERYMGLPSENTRGYEESAVFEHVPNMRGNLLIIHGLIDENVHFRHTARLINRLIASGKNYDLLMFPNERHSPRRLRDRVYMEKRMSDYFVDNLLSGQSKRVSVDGSGVRLVGGRL